VDYIYKFEGIMSKYPAKTIDTLNLYNDINNLKDEYLEDDDVTVDDNYIK